ncbi:MAG: hypothetical protein M1528_00010, partial [Candidatus Marsarchaeota archaeon]|nr:hypothetical protein [Candidatus Marsarchaeota archaeon]
PDLTSTFVSSLAIYLFIKVADSKKIKRKALFATGILIGMAPGFKTSEGLLIMGIFGIAVAVYYAYGIVAKTAKRRVKKGVFRRISEVHVLYIIAGALIPLALVAIYFNYANGNPFFNILSTAQALTKGYSSGNQSTLVVNIASMGILFDPFYYYIAHGIANIPFYEEQVQPLGLLPLLAVAGAILGIIKKNKTILFLSLIGLFCLFYLILGTQSYRIYTFSPIRPRFYTIALLPLAVTAAYPLFLLYRFTRRYSTYAAAGAVLFILALSLMSNFPVYKEMFYFGISTRNIGNAYATALNVAISQPNRATIYLAIPDVQYIIPYIQLLMHTASVDTVPVQTSTCSSASANSILVEVTGSIQNSGSIEVYLGQWMGNCTLTEIWSNATRWKTPYGNMSLYSNVYRIGWASPPA